MTKANEISSAAASRATPVRRSSRSPRAARATPASGRSPRCRAARTRGARQAAWRRSICRRRRDHRLRPPGGSGSDSFAREPTTRWRAYARASTGGGRIGIRWRGPASSHAPRPAPALSPGSGLRPRLHPPSAAGRPRHLERDRRSRRARRRRPDLRPDVAPKCGRGGGPPRAALDRLIDFELLAAAAAATASPAADPDVAEARDQVAVQLLLERELETRLGKDAIPDDVLRDLYQKALSVFVHPRLVEVGLLIVYTGARMKDEPRARGDRHRPRSRSLRARQTSDARGDGRRWRSSRRWHERKVQFTRDLAGARRTVPDRGRPGGRDAVATPATPRRWSSTRWAASSPVTSRNGRPRTSPSSRPATSCATRCTSGGKGAVPGVRPGRREPPPHRSLPRAIRARGGRR